MSIYKKAIESVLKQVHPETKINKDGLKAISEYLTKVGENIIKKLVLLKSIPVHINEEDEEDEDDNKDTISSRDVQFAVRLAIPKELGRHAISEGTKGVLKWGMGQQVNRFYDMNNFNPKFKILEDSNVYFSHVLEYLSAELLELSGSAARNNKRVNINKDFVDRAIKNDSELEKLGCLIGYNKQSSKKLIEKPAKSSTKVSRKVSTKVSRNVSRKSARKSARKASRRKASRRKASRRKASRKSSRKVSRKSVRKASRKASRKDSRKVSRRKASKKSKKCPDGKVENPATGRCVNSRGKIGKNIK